jgi:ketosteroid isomerase-like protein
MKNKLNISTIVLALFGFVAVQTTVAQAANTSPAQEALKGMRPFIGNWTGESQSFVEFEGLEEGGKIHWTMRFRWLQNKAAVEYTWQSKYKNTGKNFTTGSQIVSLDAATGKLRTIGYGHDGDVYWSNSGSVETKNKSFTQIVDEITINKTKSKYTANYTKNNPKTYSINITKIEDGKELELPVINLHRVVKTTGSTVSTEEVDKITDVLKKLSDSWGQSAVTKDTAFLKSIWADDFAYIGADGTVRDEKANLALYEDSTETYTSARLAAFNVRVYGKNFVVTDGDDHYIGKDKDGKPFKKNGRFTNVWVRQNGKWQVVAGHGTWLK